MMWYDYTFGGKKAFQAVLATAMGTWAYHSLTMDLRGANFLIYLGFLTACAGIYGFYNMQEHRIANGNGGINGKT